MLVQKEAISAYDCSVRVLKGSMEPREEPARAIPKSGASQKVANNSLHRITRLLIQAEDPGHPTHSLNVNPGGTSICIKLPRFENCYTKG